MKLLEKEKIVKHPSYDSSGYVFTYDDNLYRAIHHPYKDSVLRLFQCGLIDELTKSGLFPRSEVTDLRTSDCDLVIQHEKVQVTTLPIEWSFSMLKDAAQVTLATNIIARKYGYQTKDSHGFNVLFRYGTPLFVDLGSFVRIKNEFNSSKPGWRAFGEFMRSFYAPLKIWSRGDSFFARHALHGDQLPMSTYWRYQRPLLQLLPTSYLNTFEYLYYQYKGLNTQSIDRFLQVASRRRIYEHIAQRIIWFSRKYSLLFSSVNLESVSQQIDKINPPSIRSKWADYQTGMEVTQRHQFVIELIKELRVKNVLDLGGNTGFLARQILSGTDIDYVISADYDENAVDRLYESLREHPARIFPVLLDFSISIADTKFKKVEERLRAEAVVALALTHHLILSQGMSLDFVLGRIRSFTSKYAFVEFMPMGCYSSKTNVTPIIPDWYTREWFRAKFEQYFVPLEEKQLEPNRILFVGKLRPD